MAFIILIPGMLILMFLATFIKEDGKIMKVINRIFDGVTE